MSDQSLGTGVGIHTTPLAVSATQAACRSCPGSSRGRNRRCNFVNSAKTGDILRPKLAATSTIMCVDVEPGMRNVAAVAWNAAAKYHYLYWRFHCSIEGVAAVCIAAAPGVAAAGAAAVAPVPAAVGVAAAQGGGGTGKAIRPNRWWSRIV